MIIMRIPQQVTERVKEAPAQALRAVFSGIGQVLLVADRIKSRATEPGRAQPAATDRPGQNAAVPKDEARWRSLDETGNVRLPPEDEASAPAEPATAAPAEPATAEPAAAVEPAARRVPKYDDLTVASLRARLRNLDSAQVRILLDYEKGNAGRAAVLTMFERRIAKLESGEA